MRVYVCSAQGTTEVPVTFQMPTCTYTIHRGTQTGEEVHYATVGEPVYHVWSCPSGEQRNHFKETERLRRDVANDDLCSKSLIMIGHSNWSWTVAPAKKFIITISNLETNGMLVQNCYVEDGQGNRILIVDQNGLAILELSDNWLQQHTTVYMRA